jgi:hypothetical protein
VNHNNTPLPTILDVVENLTGERLNPRGHSLTICCPLHLERQASFSISVEKNTWHCFHDRIGGSPVELVRLVKYGAMNVKDGYREAYNYMQTMNGEAPPADREQTPYDSGASSRSNLVDTTKLVFPFPDARGHVLYSEIRLEGYEPNILSERRQAGDDDEAARAAAKSKKVFFRRELPRGAWYAQGKSYIYMDNNGEPVPWGPSDPSPVSLPRYNFDGTEKTRPTSQYVYTLRGIEHVPFALPALLAAAREHQPVILTEGPKKAQLVKNRTGITATSLAAGANAKFSISALQAFEGVSGLLIFADDDAPNTKTLVCAGMDAAIERAQLAALVVPDVRIINFFSSHKALDVADWLKLQGRDNSEALRAKIQELADNAASILPEGGIEHRGAFRSLAPQPKRALTPTKGRR